MEEKKTSKNRRSYLNDFKLQDDGKYKYEGAIYKMDESKITYKKARRLLCIGSIVVFALLLIAGLVKADGAMDTMYITIPYVLSMVFTILLTYKCICLYFSRYPLYEYEYKDTVAKYDIYATIALVLIIATFIGELIYIILNGVTKFIGGTIIFVICVIFSGLMDYMFLRFVKMLNFYSNK